MRNVTSVQKTMMTELVHEFYPRLEEVMGRGGDEEIVVRSEAECGMVRSFGDMIVEAVGERYPDNEGKNDDAILAVTISDRIISRFAKGMQDGA